MPSPNGARYFDILPKTLFSQLMLIKRIAIFISIRKLISAWAFFSCSLHRRFIFVISTSHHHMISKFRPDSCYYWILWLWIHTIAHNTLLDFQLNWKKKCGIYVNITVSVWVSEHPDIFSGVLFFSQCHSYLSIILTLTTHAKPENWIYKVVLHISPNEKKFHSKATRINACSECWLMLLAQG